MNAQGSTPRLEIRFGMLLPFFLAAGALLNLAITNPPSLRLGRVSGVALRAEVAANYGRDVPGLSFPALNPAIIEEARRDAKPAPPDPDALATPTPTPSADDNGLLDLPTISIDLELELPGLVPTVVGVVPTVVGVVPTALGAVPTVVNIVPTLLPIIPPIPTLLPLPGLFP